LSKTDERILLVGLGGVGYHLARRLSQDGHHLTIIEQEPTQIARADAELDARLIPGDAMDVACWRRAEASTMGTLIAVTDNDAVNVLAAQIGHHLGIRQKIARIRSLAVWEESPLISAADLSIDLVIRPEELAAEEIHRLLKMRAGNVVVDVGEGEMQVVATHVTPSSPLCRHSVRELAALNGHLDFRIVCVARDINTIIPDGDFKILPDDHVYILGHCHDMPALMKLAQLTHDARHNVLIVGGGLIGERVAALLQDTYPVTLLEQNAERAEVLSHRLRKTECLHGDGSEADVLIQAGLMTTDTIVAATSDNETNIITSVLAKHLMEHRSPDPHSEHVKTIALVQREEYLVLASAMGADVAVNKKVLASNEILRFIRRGQVLAVAHLHGCDAEVVELVADAGSRVTQRPLQDLDLTGIIIGAVYRGGAWKIATGTTRLATGERAVGICSSLRLGELQALFLS